ncbi:MAG: hypothetical protein HZA12_02880, partial [Nitrospirae bacterium]|nr:hypothetical protein [Nitrospirota bacterium]
YTDMDNQTPSSIRVCIDAACYAMAVDTAASATLRDGDYTNGEQYVYSSTLTDGTHNYYFDTSDGLEGGSLPPSGNLSGPIVTNTYTPAGTNVVVKPDVNVTITFDEVTTTGDTYVTNSQTGSSLPSGYLHGSPPAYFDIWTTATFTGKVRMCFTYDDQRYFGVGYGGERGLRWLHVETGSFRDRTVTLDVNTNFVCGDVYSFSEFSAAVEEATLVTLTSFRATGLDGKAVLTWATAAEIDSMGFNVLRGPSINGPFNRINNWLIRSKGTPTRGMTYTYEDIDVENGITYFYKLENVDINGGIAAHMIASATPAAPPASEAEMGTDLKYVSTTKPAAQGPATAQTPAIQTQKPAEAMPPVVVIEQPSVPAELPAEVTVEETVPQDVSKEVTEEMPLHLPSETVKYALKEEKGVGDEYPTPKDFALRIEDDEGNEISVRQIGEVIPKDPFETTVDEDGKITLRWSAKGALKGFDILRGDSSGKEFVKANTIPIPFFASQADEKGLLYAFKDGGTAKEGLYKYKIVTIMPDGTLRESKIVEAGTELKKRPEKPDAKPVLKGVPPEKQ